MLALGKVISSLANSLENIYAHLGLGSRLAPCDRRVVEVIVRYKGC